jgi:hypothetical protein
VLNEAAFRRHDTLCDPSPAATQPGPGRAPNSPLEPPAASAGSSGSSGSGSQAPLEATFRLCGTADPQAERAVEQLIAGRGFSARLTGGSDGCAELTVEASQASARSSTSHQSVSMAVSSGSGSPARTITVRINSEYGVTRVSIGSGS